MSTQLNYNLQLVRTLSWKIPTTGDLQEIAFEDLQNPYSRCFMKS